MPRVSQEDAPRRCPNLAVHQKYFRYSRYKYDLSLRIVSDRQGKKKSDLDVLSQFHLLPV